MKKFIILLLTGLLMSCSTEETQQRFTDASEYTSEEVISYLIGEWQLVDVNVEDPLVYVNSNCPFSPPPNSQPTNPPIEEWRDYIKNEILSKNLSVVFYANGDCLYGDDNLIWRVQKDPYGEWMIIFQKADWQQLNGDWCEDEYRKILSLNNNSLSFQTKCFTNVDCPQNPQNYFGSTHTSDYIFTKN